MDWLGVLERHEEGEMVWEVRRIQARTCLEALDAVNESLVGTRYWILRLCEWSKERADSVVEMGKRLGYKVRTSGISPPSAEE